MIQGIHHIQLTIPSGSEKEALAFYHDLLALEPMIKPKELQANGGLWFRCGRHELHLGIENKAHALNQQSKRHLALSVASIDEVQKLLKKAGFNSKEDVQLPNQRRLKTRDPFGNLLEFIEYL